VGEVEAESRGGGRARKTDTDNARKRSADWAVKKLWRLLGEAARSQVERKKSVDWTLKDFPWRVAEEARH
jgi:hypothetical protein